MQTPYESLYNELAEALLAGKPEALISTPGYSQPEHRAEYIVSDNFAGQDDTSLADLLRIVAQVAAGKPAQAAALTWIAGRAEKHAKFHADDLAEQDEGLDPDEWHDRMREESVFSGVAA